MKKFFKILALYLLFGIIIALAITIFGGQRFLINGLTLGFMNINDYLLLTLYVIVLWLPLCVIVLFSKINLFKNAYITSITIIILIIFVLLSVLILTRKRK